MIFISKFVERYVSKKDCPSVVKLILAKACQAKNDMADGDVSVTESEETL